MCVCVLGIEEDILSKCIYEKKCVFNDDYLIYIYSVYLVYCVKKESKFSKDISGEETSSKVPTNTPHVFHFETMHTPCFHVVSTSEHNNNMEHTQCICRAETIIK